MSSIRVLVADDHNLFRKGIISMLASDKEIFIVGEARNGRELIKLYFELLPDLVLADISMPEMSGTEAVEKIMAKDPGIKTLFLSMHEDEEYIYYTFKAGGKGLISKDIEEGELHYAIRTILEGNFYFGNIWKGNKLQELIKKFEAVSDIYEDEKLRLLSGKELETFKLIGKGFTSIEIAEKFGTSKRTVDAHRVNIMQKFGLKSYPELMKYAIQYVSSKKKPAGI
jgi:DNA-binding NarL/FixJ family response regulator